MDTTDKHTPQSVTRDEPRDFMESMLYWHERAMTSEKELSNVRTIKNEIAETAKEYMDANDSLQKELSEARGRIERLEAGWVSVKERLPEDHNKQYQVWVSNPFFTNNNQHVATLQGNGWGGTYWSGIETNVHRFPDDPINVTHWRELPEPPKP